MRFFTISDLPIRLKLLTGDLPSSRFGWPLRDTHISVGGRNRKTFELNRMKFVLRLLSVVTIDTHCFSHSISTVGFWQQKCWKLWNFWMTFDIQSVSMVFWSESRLIKNFAHGLVRQISVAYTVGFFFNFLCIFLLMFCQGCLSFALSSNYSQPLRLRNRLCRTYFFVSMLHCYFRYLELALIGKNWSLFLLCLICGLVLLPDSVYLLSNSYKVSVGASHF